MIPISVSNLKFISRVGVVYLGSGIFPGGTYYLALNITRVRSAAVKIDLVSGQRKML